MGSNADGGEKITVAFEVESFTVLTVGNTNIGTCLISPGYPTPTVPTLFCKGSYQNSIHILFIVVAAEV